MIGLIHPSDLRAWQSWHESRHKVRLVARSLNGRGVAETPSVDLLTPPRAELLVCIEASHASVANAVASTLTHLPTDKTAILCPSGWIPPDSFDDHTRISVGPDPLHESTAEVAAVLATGHFTPIGSIGHEMATRAGAAFFVSQHGALTPFAPPLPPNARLLAWSGADAEFWRSGRHDVRCDVVGSQLLWNAAGGGTPRDQPETTDVLTYLGQMHGAELPRNKLVRAAASFCWEHDATYRPHPSERDKLSRLAHAGYRRLGIRVEGSTPLADLTGPVISVFSTGVLEAAAQGREAWVDFPRPPAWLAEFWERYDMHRFGDAATPPPSRPDEEPTRRIARVLMESVS